MESRNVTLTLEQAKEWYEKGGDLREVALKAYTEKELKARRFESITDFNKVLEFLYIAGGLSSYTNPSDIRLYITKLESVSKSAAANLKLSLIRKALNWDEGLSLTQGQVWYPYTPFVKSTSRYYDDEVKSGQMKEVAKFNYNGENYTLLGGNANNGAFAGLGYFFSYNGVGGAGADVGFLGCSTKEIAQHFGLYFWKELFEAKYADYINFMWL